MFSFFSQCLLNVIFWKLGKKADDDTRQTETSGSSLSITITGAFDPQQIVEARTWNMFV